MTTPINPGDLVSVPDPSTGGAGAPVIVSQVMNGNWRNGLLLMNKAFLLMDAAINDTNPAPQIVAPHLDTSYLPPPLPVLPDNNPANAKAIYDDARLEIQALTEGGYVNFLNTYFPTEAFYPAALAWLDRALTQGGTGINAGVEAQLWERGRSRLGAEAMRAKADLMQGFANRGFPLPPGPLLHATQLVDQDMRDKLAEQSRDISIESFRAELENTRLAITTAIDMRFKAVNAAAQYIAMLLEGPKTAMQLATAQVGFQTEYARTLVQFYTAQAQAVDPRIRLSIADAQIQAQIAEANLRSKNLTDTNQGNKAQEAARMVASAAAASLNGINAGASISGSDSTAL